jgi:(p)ppGpp synthase/HD superfamily hydrolase
LYPNKYEEVKELIKNEAKRTNRLLDETQKKLEKVFKKEKFEYVKMYGRKKHFYSIYRKMENEGKKFSEILDYLALRIITKSKKDCYRALGIAHEVYRPIPTKLKDYISSPKINLYQALHTTIIVEKVTIEIQIRDEEMEDTANFGIASHFLYKDNNETMENLQFFKYIKKYVEQYEDRKDKQTEIIKDTMFDVFGVDITVLTPKGEMIALPKGASALDFAFKLHTNIGLKAKKAIINGVASPLSTSLNPGDLVEIETDEAHILRIEAIN